MTRLLFKWFAALLLITQFSGCGAFLEDYNYNPIGTTQSSSSGSY